MRGRIAAIAHGRLWPLLEPWETSDLSSRKVGRSGHQPLQSSVRRLSELVSQLFGVSGANRV
jgi:hypothetical protein